MTVKYVSYGMNVQKQKMKMNKEQGKEKMVGVYVPQPISEYLSLIAIDRGVAKSRIILELIEGYIYKKENDEGTDVETLIERITRKIQSEWKISKASIINKDHIENEFTYYIRHTKLKLENKGINKEIVNTIIEQIHI